MNPRLNKAMLASMIFRGREGEDPYERDAQGQVVENDDGEKQLKDGWEFNDDGQPVKVDDPDDDDDNDSSDNGDDDDIEELRKKLAAKEKALTDERRLRRKAERDSKRAARKKTTSDKPDDDESGEKLKQAEARAERLAAGLKREKVDAAIEKVARKLNFIDPSDALLDDIRAEIDVDQDEDDPSNIDIDMDSVNDAVKDLAARKKHLVGEPAPRERSGSRFGKGGSRTGDASEKQVLHENYPSLRD